MSDAGTQGILLSQFFSAPFPRLTHHSAFSNNNNLLLPPSLSPFLFLPFSLPFSFSLSLSPFLFLPFSFSLSLFLPPFLFLPSFLFHRLFHRLFPPTFPRFAEDELGLEHDISVLLKRTKKEYLVPERIAPGEYRFGQLGPFKIVKLRRHLMVRLPNTWNTLEHVLCMHDTTSGGPRSRRRNSLVMDVVEDKEREMSVAAALAQRRLSRHSSVSDAYDASKRVLSAHDRIDEEGSDSSAGSGTVALRQQVTSLQTKAAEADKAAQAAKGERAKLQQMYDEEKARTAELEAELEEAAAAQQERATLDSELASLRTINNNLKKQVSDLSDAAQASDYFKTEAERLRKEVQRLNEEHAREKEASVARAASAAKLQEQDFEKRIASLQQQLSEAQVGGSLMKGGRGARG